MPVLSLAISQGLPTKLKTVFAVVDGTDMQQGLPHCPRNIGCAWSQFACHRAQAPAVVRAGRLIGFATGRLSGFPGCNLIRGCPVKAAHQTNKQTSVLSPGSNETTTLSRRFDLNDVRYFACYFVRHMIKHDLYEPLGPQTVPKSRGDRLSFLADTDYR